MTKIFYIYIIKLKILLNLALKLLLRAYSCVTSQAVDKTVALD
jgi:hypothetical protein